AGAGAVSLEPAGMEPPRAHLSERARRWCGLAVVVAPPAGDGAVCLQPAGVVAPRADVGERARGWRRLAGVVVPPAGDGTVGLDRAGVAHSPPHVVAVPPALRPPPAQLGEPAPGPRRPPPAGVSPSGAG